MVKIAIDAMGGDFAPREQVLGAVAALNKDKDLSVILCGDETQIKAVLSECKYDESRVEIVHTTEVITMEEAPAMAVKTKKDSSTVVAFRLVKEGADTADGANIVQHGLGGVGEIVNNNNVITCLNKFNAGMAAYVSGAAGDKNGHGRSSFRFMFLIKI